MKADDWIVNGVNRSVSHSFGYGLMDAGGMVRLARNWTKVPPQHICEIRSRDVDKPIPMNGKITVYLDTDGCEGVLDHVKYLEHVQARITLTASRRGEIQIFLISPMGTRSTLLARRAHDNSREGFNNWAFMTTHSWGETAKGTWILEIENGASSSQLKQWSLVMRGTLTHPQKKNDSTPSYMPIQQPFKCAGITNNGVCIECKPGFYRYGEGCVPNCPDHYYGEMETVLVGNSGNTSSKSSSYNRHGVCKKCNAACKTCKGPYVTDCYQCSNGYEVRDGQCHKKPLMNFLDPDMLSFFVWVIILCTSLILLFGVVFIVLQARDHRILCWKEKRHYDDSKGKYNGITVNLSAGQESDSEHIEHVLQNRHTNNLNTCNIYHNNYTHQHA